MCVYEKRVFSQPLAQNPPPSLAVVGTHRVIRPTVQNYHGAMD